MDEKINFSFQSSPVGVMGLFSSAHALEKAVLHAREKGITEFEVYTPYPVHGLEEKQGLSRSFLPFVTLVAGLTGVSCGFLLQYWTSVIDWPIIVGGKPMNSWPAFVPVLFETTILFAGLWTVAAMFFLNGLPNTKKKSYDPRITQDQFAFVFENPSCGFLSTKKKDWFSLEKASQATELLKAWGASEIKPVYDEAWFE